MRQSPSPSPLPVIRKSAATLAKRADYDDWIEESAQPMSKRGTTANSCALTPSLCQARCHMVVCKRTKFVDRVRSAASHSLVLSMGWLATALPQLVMAETQEESPVAAPAGLTEIDPTVPVDPPSSFSTEYVFRPNVANGYDPFESPAAPLDPFDAQDKAYDPFDAPRSTAPRNSAQQGGAKIQTTKRVTDALFSSSHVAALDRFTGRQVVNLQPPTQLPPQSQAQSSPAAEELPSQVPAPEDLAGSKAATRDPCAAMVPKPLGELGINILLPSGLLPKDYAAGCIQRGFEGSYSADLQRSWSTTSYHWDPTCLCYRPLYFEEINLERYGYGCCECVQPAVSAAHFFVTMPVLPYCMAIDCPCQCQYALGTYRPGSCPPWRRNWPQCWPNCF